MTAKTTSVTPDHRGRPLTRIHALDVSRAIAILGMILVNFRAQTVADESGVPWLGWIVDRVEGKAAALFIVLAGVGLSLRARASTLDGVPLETTQRSFARRAAALFVLGLLNLHVWEWDILHCYGLFVLVGSLLVFQTNAQLFRSAVLILVTSISLQAVRTEVVVADFWHPLGALLELTWVGLYPFFPWGVFLIFGLWLGRLDLRQAPGGRRGVIAAASVVLGLELLTDYLVQDYEFGPVGLTLESSFVVWPRPGGIAFVVSSLCCAYLVLRLCLAAEARWRDGIAFDWLARTGRLSLTIYFAHIWALLIAEHHGWFLYNELGAVLGYGVLLFIACGALARWWTLRYEHGPIEVVLRQVADPPEVAPTRPRVV